MSRLKAIGLAALVSGILASPGAWAQDLEKVSIVVFGPPSLGAFLPPVIKNQKFDEKHGLSIEFVERPPDAYTTQFNSGEFQVGGSAALLTVGLAEQRGVKVTYLFNLFDFWGAVVTSRPEIKQLKDLDGKGLVAARGTTNFVMFDWFARQQGLDVSKLSVVNTATPGLVGYALADRAVAVQLWEPAYTILKAKKPDIRALDLDIPETWKKFAGSTNIPYLGVAAHVGWASKNGHLIPKMYAAYKDAAAWVTANPDAAAKLIHPKGAAEDQKAIADLIKANDRLGMNVVWASQVRKEINSVYQAGKSIGFLSGDPSAATIYAGPMK
ncbi:ABC transporter substrate-binding protein [Pseudorhodoplanes sp.]|uniref:ABC transporter substrate-binding protein n=1 Tax=Pseudorhodoplanes sp. TaxID=1934341 RepID=UPI003919BC19